MLIDGDIGCKNIFKVPNINAKNNPNVQLLNQHIAGYLDDCEAYVQETEDHRRRKLLKNKRNKKKRSDKELSGTMHMNLDDGINGIDYEFELPEELNELLSGSKTNLNDSEEGPQIMFELYKKDKEGDKMLSLNKNDDCKNGFCAKDFSFQVTNEGNGAVTGTFECSTKIKNRFKKTCDEFKDEIIDFYRLHIYLSRKNAKRQLLETVGLQTLGGKSGQHWEYTLCSLDSKDAKTCNKGQRRRLLQGGGGWALS
jgi:hypothetical protein